MDNKPEQVYIINIPNSQPSTATTDNNNMHGSTTTEIIVSSESKMCRICATMTEMVMPIFEEEGVQNNLADKIHKYLPIQVSEQDLFPRVVCYQCVSTLLAFHELVLCCEQVDVALRSRQLSPELTNQASNSNVPDTSTVTDKDDIKFQGRTSSCDDISNEYDAASDRNESNSEDDEPLCNIVDSKSQLFKRFYQALVNFRNHFENEHTHKKCSYPDFTDNSDSNDSEDDVAEDDRNVDVNSFDDLTDSNMRKGRMDDETREELKQVQKRVNRKILYMCKICGKALSSAHTYLFHQRIHTNERPCVCHICGKQFRTPNGLHRHLTSTHERLRRHTCLCCSKTFANAQNLRQHVRIHTGEQPYVCAQCGKRFTQSGTLHVHLKTHIDHFPYHCAECGAKFRLKSGLTRHRLKHTGERPHVCHCGKSYRQKRELNNHILTHTDSKPHPCTLCGATFRHRRALRLHAKRVHDLVQPNLFTQLALPSQLPYQ